MNAAVATVVVYAAVVVPVAFGFLAPKYLIALIWLVPFAWALITSLRPDDEITANPTTPWSNHWTWHAYTSVWNAIPIK